MAWDPAMRKIVLFGGLALHDAKEHRNLGGTWTWSGGRWQRVATAGGPAAREVATMAYDPGLGGLVLFGGVGDPHGRYTYFADTWLFRGGRWTRLTTEGAPTARAFTSMAWDAAARAVVLFGGFDGQTLGGAWKLEG